MMTPAALDLSVPAADASDPRLIVALDVPTIAEAQALVARIGDEAVFFKIGYQLAFAGGLELARDLKASGRKVFLDMKLLDIDNTVARGVENVVPGRRHAHPACLPQGHARGGRRRPGQRPVPVGRHGADLDGRG